MYTEYSKYYKMIDETKYEFKSDGIYSKRFNRKIEGYPIGNLKRYYQSRFTCTDGKTRSLYIHVALWIHFNGDIPEDKELNHKDEDQSNNSLDNLELLTHKENMNYGTVQQRKAETNRNRKKEGK